LIEGILFIVSKIPPEVLGGEKPFAEIERTVGIVAVWDIRENAVAGPGQKA